MTPVPRDNYRIGIPIDATYKLLFNSDAMKYGGSDRTVKKSFSPQNKSWHGRENSVELRLPPLGVLVYKI